MTPPPDDLPPFGGLPPGDAARLLDALLGWARNAADELEGRIATGTPECAMCPLCRAISALRGTSGSASVWGAATSGAGGRDASPLAAVASAAAAAAASAAAQY